MKDEVMQYLSPTPGILDTFKNVRGFIKANKSTLWAIYFPLLPYIIFFSLLDVLLPQVLFEPDSSGEYTEIGIGGLINTYFFTCLVISWHRVVVYGPDKYTPMNPLKPKKSELVFLGMSILIGIIGFVAGFVIAFAAAMTGADTWIIGLSVVLAIVLVVYACLKLSFYFPSKATYDNVTLKKSLKMTNGYKWRILVTPILALLPLTLLMLAYAVFGLLVLFGVGFGVGMADIGALDNSWFGLTLGLLFALPLVVYFYPLFYVIGVTVLSNYYMHALQHKGVPD